ncbi:hypothetical protein PHMEG_00021929 [Phytophthora megakarya]|uniref:Uncharacterized protein n=1 Tax=Phytophthora megakarya TaxID=4795 RepID=A0A225VMA7_9STRA|nr:hypothetical protein PHMEG_00021929 [Phytophthora megakarya]
MAATACNVPQLPRKRSDQPIWHSPTHWRNGNTENYKSEVERMKEGLTEKVESMLKRNIHGSVVTIEEMEMAFEAVLARSNGETLFGAVLLSMHQPHHIQVFTYGMGAFIECQNNLNCLLGLSALSGSYGAQGSRR